jgi:hypothetical protein
MAPAEAAPDIQRSDAGLTLPRLSVAAGHDAAIAFADGVRQARLRLEAAGDGIARLAPSIAALRRIEQQLRRPLRLALLGEFNSGKSTLANLMIGNAPLPTLQISNTRIPTLIQYHAEPFVAAALPGGRVQRLTASAFDIPSETLRIHVGMPMPHLSACEILDFPGLSDPWLTYGIMDVARHPVDAAIWCTFSTQAWKESESTAWNLLPARIRAEGMLVVTNQDLLGPDQAAKVMARLRKVAGGEFKELGLISSVRARKALEEDGRIGDAQLWQASGAADFYGAVQRILSAIRQRRLEKAKALTSSIAGAALALLEAEPAALR